MMNNPGAPLLVSLLAALISVMAVAFKPPDASQLASGAVQMFVVSLLLVLLVVLWRNKQNHSALLDVLCLISAALPWVKCAMQLHLTTVEQFTEMLDKLYETRMLRSWQWTPWIWGIRLSACLAGALYGKLPRSRLYRVLATASLGLSDLAAEAIVSFAILGDATLVYCAIHTRTCPFLLGNVAVLVLSRPEHPQQKWTELGQVSPLQLHKATSDRRRATYPRPPPDGSGRPPPDGRRDVPLHAMHVPLLGGGREMPQLHRELHREEPRQVGMEFELQLNRAPSASEDESDSDWGLSASASHSSDGDDEMLMEDIIYGVAGPPMASGG